MLEFLEKHTAAVHSDSPAMYKAHLAGNSIYMDRAFLRKNMPLVDAHLHWRLIDVSTVLELARRWFPSEFKKAPKKKVECTNAVGLFFPWYIPYTARSIQPVSSRILQIFESGSPC